MIFQVLHKVIAVLVSLLTGGCATLDSIASKVDRYRQEADDTLAAVEAVLRECESMPEPRPALCVQAARLEALLYDEHERLLLGEDVE